jgi:predicted Zn-dependent protease
MALTSYVPEPYWIRYMPAMKPILFRDLQLHAASKSQPAKLLGVSRDFELEADRLGIQYAWNAGYDTTGFIRFFDRMATKVGYVNGVSWFRTHPPFYERMIDAQREIMYLPSGKDQTVQSSEFLQMKKDLAPVSAEAE